MLKCIKNNNGALVSYFDFIEPCIKEKRVARKLVKYLKLNYQNFKTPIKYMNILKLLFYL